MAILAGTSLLLFVYGLGKYYLWQDEAETAILGERMFAHGKPFAYDGTNLVTADLFEVRDFDLVSRNSTNPAATIDYCVQRGELKPDTAWKRNPWGQFIFAGTGLKLFGHTTAGARLPFVLAGVATVMVLFVWLRRIFDTPLIALLAAAFLGFNSYWILHSRQCRYYSISGLFLLLTLIAFDRWQRDRRWGAVGFISAAWCWFQMDFGTFWPVMGTLFLAAAIRRRAAIWRPLVVGLALAAAIAPFVWYYEIWSWAPAGARPWRALLRINLLNFNRYILPIPLLLLAVAVLIRQRKHLTPGETGTMAVGCGVLLALMLWVPLTAPTALVRYIAMAMPVGAMLAAWAIVRVVGTRPQILVWLAAVLMVLTPVFCLPFDFASQSEPARTLDYVVRPELRKLASEIFGTRPDPNRAVVAWLKANSTPTDEILINYEDLPLVFYLPNPIRGGVAAFRVEDDAKSPPRFFVIRRSVGFVHWPIFAREIERYKWERIAVAAPDVPWGNNQDPMFDYEDPAKASPLTLGRRILTESK